jgi:hypothetical protein
MNYKIGDKVHFHIGGLEAEGVIQYMDSPYSFQVKIKRFIKFRDDRLPASYFRNITWWIGTKIMVRDEFVKLIHFNGQLELEF